MNAYMYVYVYGDDSSSSGGVFSHRPRTSTTKRPYLTCFKAEVCRLTFQNVIENCKIFSI